MTIALGLAAGLLAILRPWTVVPIESTTKRTFDSESYVTSIWTSRVLPAAQTSAIDLQAFMAGPSRTSDGPGAGRRAVFVKGTAIVDDVDRKSRVGLARLRLPWANGSQAAAIQIGPVLRGTALRDALDFVRFTDFVNQLEFAAVANELNDRVVKDVLGAVNPDQIAGREATFVGAVPATSAGSTIEIVPVQLQIAPGGVR